MDLPPEPQPPHRRPGGRARPDALLAAGVAVVEAVLAGAGATVSLLSGLQGGSFALGGAVAVVAAGLSWLLVEAARGFARGRRWPVGVFVTVQLLLALVALSLGGRALLTAVDNPGIAMVTAGALVLAATGLVGVRLAVAAGDREADPA